MTKASDNPAPHAGEKENGRVQDGQAMPPSAGGPGIPPLPEPNVEGVGNESGPSAGRGIGKLSSDQNKMAKDGKMRAEV